MDVKTNYRLHLLAAHDWLLQQGTLAARARCPAANKNTSIMWQQNSSEMKQNRPLLVLDELLAKRRE